jgi:hypothetical protein
MNNLASYENRLLNAYLDDFSRYDDIHIIDANDGDCIPRKKSGRKPRHIMINGECVLCKGITNDELDLREKHAREAAYDDAYEASL